VPYTPELDWTDWNGTGAPPANVRRVKAADILRWERGLAEAHDEMLRAPDMRISAARLTAPNSNSAAAALDVTQRTVLQFPFTTGRWRMWFANRSLRSTTVLTTPAQITGVWTGAPTRDTANSSGHRWQGAATGALTQRAGAITVPTDGTKVFTPWIDGDPFEDGLDKLISWGLTTTNTGNGIASGNGYQGATAPGAANASVEAPAGLSVAQNVLYLDVGIEYELDDAVQIVLVIGDSNGVSYSGSQFPTPSSITGVPASVLPHESWSMVAGAMAGASVINVSVGSVSPGDYAVTNQHLWDMIPAGTKIDVAIIPVGINGINGGMAGFTPHLRTINQKVRDLGCRRIFWCTMPPAGYATEFGRLTSPAAVAATTVTMDTSPAVGTILIGSGFNSEEVTVASVAGTGPYTVTLSAGLTMAHSPQEPVSWGKERNRRLLNGFLRNIPDGIAGVVDFEALLESSPDSPVGDPRFVDNDGLHWNRGASGIRAQITAPIMTRTRFA